MYKVERRVCNEGPECNIGLAVACKVHFILPEECVYFLNLLQPDYCSQIKKKLPNIKCIHILFALSV